MDLPKNNSSPSPVIPILFKLIEHNTIDPLLTSSRTLKPEFKCPTNILNIITPKYIDDILSNNRRRPVKDTMVMHVDDQHRITLGKAIIRREVYNHPPSV